MKPGDITQPLRVAKGYQIFKLETNDDADSQPFESVRDLIADKVTPSASAAKCASSSRGCAPGDHRVEERGAEEGLRTGRQARRGAAGLSAARSNLARPR